jgi:hypothetical protein
MARRIVNRGALAAAALVACSSMASAAFIQTPITGGGAGAGVDLSGTVVYAVDAVNTGNVVQGVTFTGMSATTGVSVTGGQLYTLSTTSGTTTATSPVAVNYTNFTAPTYTSLVGANAAANNTQLDSVMKGVAYDTGIYSITFSGLNAAQTYEVEVLIQEVADAPSGHADRDFFITASTASHDGTEIVSPTAELGGNQGINAVDTFTGLTNLTLTYTLDQSGPHTADTFTTAIDGGTPAVNAIVLEAIAPEPGTLALSAMGSLALLTRRRRRIL